MDGIKLRIIIFEKLTQEWSQSTQRRAGLYGLSAIGVALYQKDVRSLLLTLLEKDSSTGLPDCANLQ